MKTLLACGLVASLALFTACGGEEDPMGDPPDAGGGSADAADNTPRYPAGPYGEGPGDVIRDLQWVSFVDGDDADLDPLNDPVRLLSLSEYYRGNDPDAKVIMINSAAGWCGPCMQEASELSAVAADYEPLGARFVSCIFEDANGDPADEEFVRYWANQFNLTIPAAIDTTFLVGPYFDINAMPMNMFVDANNMEIITITTGTDGTGNLQAFRDILEYYTSQP